MKDDVTTYVPAPTVSHMSIMVRSNAMVVLAFIALVVFLHWAQAIFIPITFSVFLSYALTPIVNWLQKNAKLPKAVGAAATLAIILGALGWGLNSLQPEALDVLDIVSRATEKFSIAIHGNPREPEGAVEKMKKQQLKSKRQPTPLRPPRPPQRHAPQPHHRYGLRPTRRPSRYAIMC